MAGIQVMEQPERRVMGSQGLRGVFGNEGNEDRENAGVGFVL